MASRIEELRESYQRRADWYKEHYGKSFKTDKNGTLYFADTRCCKCGGQGGLDQWAYTGFTCYRCGGSGLDPHPDVAKLYLPEYEVKLEERRAKANAKRIAKLEAEAEEKRISWLVDNQFTPEGRTFLFLGNTYQMKDAIKETGAMFDKNLGWHISEKIEGYEFLEVNIKDVAEPTYTGYIINKDMADAKKEAERTAHPSEYTSEYQGEIKERLKNLKLTITFETEFQGFSYSYYDDGTKYFYSMEDEVGNIFTWTTSAPMNFHSGDSIVIDGTVKEHKEYKGDKQTVLQRCKVKCA